MSTSHTVPIIKFIKLLPITDLCLVNFICQSAVTCQRLLHKAVINELLRSCHVFVVSGITRLLASSNLSLDFKDSCYEVLSSQISKDLTLLSLLHRDSGLILLLLQFIVVQLRDWLG